MRSVLFIIVFGDIMFNIPSIFIPIIIEKNIKPESNANALGIKSNKHHQPLLPISCIRRIPTLVVGIMVIKLKVKPAIAEPKNYANKPIN